MFKMTEEFFYLTIPQTKRTIFCHLYLPVLHEHKAFFFLDPIFEEQNNVKTHQVKTARQLCTLGYFVLRFDYYATGDSLGEVYEFDALDTLEDIRHLFNIFINRYELNIVKILGIRFGASLAFLLANSDMRFREIHLVEPIIKGKRYLRFIRMRTELFFKKNQLVDNDLRVMLKSATYEDHLGYLLSKRVLQFLETLDLNIIPLEGKGVFLYTLDPICKLTEEFYAFHSVRNEVKICDLNGDNFWDYPEIKHEFSLFAKLILKKSSFDNS